MSSNCVFIIDPQRDFMPGGALGVPGADKDMQRLSEFILKYKGSINKIVVTLDSHNLYHISHPVWWVDKEGNHPEPFTPITKEALDQGLWKTKDPYVQDISEGYIEQLHPGTHTIWPPHCLIGTEGHAIEKNLMEAIHEWERSTLHTAEYVFKGTVPFSEHYGAFRAQVPFAGHPKSLFNTDLFDLVFSYDKLIIAGEASSHCVAQTISQMARHADRHEESPTALFKKIIYLKDACSPVPGFEAQEETLEGFLDLRGVTISTTDAVELI